MVLRAAQVSMVTGNISKEYVNGIKRRQTIGGSEGLKALTFVGWAFFEFDVTSVVKRMNCSGLRNGGRVVVDVAGRKSTCGFVRSDMKRRRFVKCCQSHFSHEV